MTDRARAWTLYAGGPKESGPGQLVGEEIDLPALGENGVLCEPLYGCWGGNMTHALERSPADICRQRREERVVLGNAAVVRVLRSGTAPAAQALREGQLAILFSASEVDRYGYTVKALAYDAAGTMGCLATRMVVRAHELLPLPDNTRHPLPRWAAFSGSSITAWSNFELAHGTLRLLLNRTELPAPHVWGWGGGTTLAELDLARRHSCLTVQLSSHPLRRETIARAGVEPLDRSAFPHLSFDEARFASDLTYRRGYLESEQAFLREVEKKTNGEGVHIFVDYIGQPVYRATLKALARQGIITTAGWKRGMMLTHLRAAECIARHQHINTHYARRSQGVEAVAYAEREEWLPHVDAGITTFDQIPELAKRYAAGDAGFYPIFEVNKP